MKSVLIQEVSSMDELHIIDVREIDEVATGKIPNALNIPLSEISDRLNELSQEKLYHVVCASGNRSLQACKILEDSGFDVVNLMGGMNVYRNLNRSMI